MELSGGRNEARHRRAISAVLVLISSVVCLLACGGAVYLFSRRAPVAVIDPMLTEVRMGEFVSQVLDQGEIQSSENVEIRCRARARNGTINVLAVVPEGTQVKGGDFLVQLDDTMFQKELETQKIAEANARTSVIEADAAYKVAIESKKEYEEGLFIEQKKTIENEQYEANAAIETANQELSQAQAALAHSEVMQSKGFITLQQLRADQFSVERAKLNLEKAKNSFELAKTKLNVLENITRQKEVIRLDSDIEAAKVKKANAEEALQVEQSLLAEIQTQIDNCDIRVPPGVEGQVVYGKETGRGGNTEWVLEEGAAVRENQVLMKLPNPKKMEVKALINEQRITSIEVGDPANIKVDALNNQLLKGVVTRVSQYAEQAGWGMSSTIRKYAVLVRIIDPPDSLKPGMNASVNIQVQYEPKGMLVPIQAVYGVGDQKFCLVKGANGVWETREIEVAGDNAMEVLVANGLQEGEVLAMNPGAYKEYMDLPAVASESKIELPEGSEVLVNASNNQPAGPLGESPAPEGDGGERRGGGRGGRGGGPGMDPAAMVQMFLERYDSNGDGSLDASELGAIDGRMRDRLGSADSNGDGSLSREELEESTRRMAEQAPQRGGGAGEGRFGSPGASN